MKTRYYLLLFGLIVSIPQGHNLASFVSINWFDELTVELHESIIWFADHETGDLNQWTEPDWEYPGGGVFNTGEANEAWAVVTDSPVHSGEYAVEAGIQGAYRGQNGNRAVRLMRWTDRAWDNDGDSFPQEAYYSVWFYLPYAYDPTKFAPWDPGDGGWWNVFQFKSNDEEEVSQPVWVLNIANDNAPYFYLYSNYNPPHSFVQQETIPIPVAEWIHIQAYYRQSSENSGTIRIWQNGQLIFDIDEVVTVLADSIIWGIGNYTDHITGGPVPGEAIVYFDDAAISLKSLNSALDVESESMGSPTSTRSSM